MKKILAAIVCILLTTNICLADNIKKLFDQGVKEYKDGNYVESADIMSNIVSLNPGNILAHYYLAISDVQIGKINSAKDEYNNVLKLDPNSQIGLYAKKGLQMIDKMDVTKNMTGSNNYPQDNNAHNQEATPQDKPQLSKDANKNLNKPQLRETNHSNSQAASTTNKKPTPEEIVKALEVLKQAGLSNTVTNPIQNTTNTNNANIQYNAEAMKDQMLLNMLNSNDNGNNNNNNNTNMFGNNNYNSMLPYMMLMQNQGNNKNNSQMSQEAINSLLMPNMMNGINSDF